MLLLLILLALILPFPSLLTLENIRDMYLPSNNPEMLGLFWRYNDRIPFTQCVSCRCDFVPVASACSLTQTDTTRPKQNGSEYAIVRENRNKEDFLRFKVVLPQKHGDRMHVKRSRVRVRLIVRAVSFKKKRIKIFNVGLWGSPTWGLDKIDSKFFYEQGSLFVHWSS